MIRYRKDGDKIVPLGMNGSKKLKDIFIDLKIESWYFGNVSQRQRKGRRLPMEWKKSIPRKAEAQLTDWRLRKSGKALLVNGARQVGKTYILRKFGEEQFENTVYVNLETNLAAASYFAGDISPKKILQYLEVAAGEAIRPGKTLLFLDEIQACERALKAVIYF